ncbi:MAG TPA: hypothetical protein VJN96_04140 [Vicinamibacterales bacterium]|nr:hypothetical protein [Vicinamibacterales bacterium]
MRRTFLALALLSIAITSRAAWLTAAPTPPPPAVTFSETIAPIVFDNCVTCHRPGEAAPFSLMSYDDVAKRGSTIASVTKSRLMPPWRAAHDGPEFLGERRLTDEQITAIGEWVRLGMPKGDLTKLPPLPKFADGWQLGTPDLVLEMPEAFDVPADGPDIYRNFTIPTGLADDKWIRAIEFRPGTRRVVHHALFSFVRGGSTASLSMDGKPGFNGMMPVSFVPAFAPSGDLGGWAVGGTPRALPEGLASPIGKGSDFILQLHLHPTGKPEQERSKIGLYFTDTAPARKFREMGAPGLFGFLAGIDIPPGEKHYELKGTFNVFANMLAYAVTAHAHYLGKEIKAVATFPDKTTQTLLSIPNWNFNWQDRYFYKTPVLLPKGTKIDVTIVYDNSAENPANPCNPPRRVQWGFQSQDEMGGVRFLTVAASDADEVAIQNMTKAVAGALANQIANSETAQRLKQQQEEMLSKVGQVSINPCGG